MTSSALLPRVFCNAGPLTFLEVMRRVHNTVAEGLAHADVPQMQVIAELAQKQKLWPFDAVPYQVCLCALNI